MTGSEVAKLEPPNRAAEHIRVTDSGHSLGSFSGILDTLDSSSHKTRGIGCSLPVLRGWLHAQWVLVPALPSRLEEEEEVDTYTPR